MVSVTERLRIVLDLKGANEYITRMRESGEQTLRFAKAERLAAQQAERLTHRTWLQNQAMFTLRRYTFYTTLAISTLAGEVIKMGFEFQSQMQQARVAFTGFLPNAQAVNQELTKMYILAAKTPFTFQDIVLATRRLEAFTHDINLTNQLVQSLADSLAAAGTIGGQYLTRATIALQHMYSIGRLTGQVLYSMSRDNIPMMQALEKRYHMTGLQIKSLVASGLISAKAAGQAFIDYTNTTAGITGKAALASTQTLQGAWSTFTDYVRFAIGQNMIGPFAKFTGMLNSFNTAMEKGVVNGKITMLGFVTALDARLTPTSHALVTLFNLLSGYVMGLAVSFKALYYATYPVFWILGRIVGAGKRNEVMFKALGFALAVLTAIWITYRINLMRTAIVEHLVQIRTEAVTAVQWALNAAQRIGQIRTLNFVKALYKWAFAEEKVAYWVGYEGEVQKVNNGIIAKSIRGISRLAIYIWRTVIPAIGAWIAETWAEFVALSALQKVFMLLGIGLIVAAIALLVIYWSTWTHWIKEAAQWMWKHWTYMGLILLAIPVFGVLIYMVGMLVKHWRDIAGWIETAYNWLKKFVNMMFVGPAKWLWRHTGGLLHFQSGGITPGGPVVVGERGPEIAVPPAGTRIIPHHQIATAMAGAGGFVVKVYPQPIHLDGKKIAEVIATVKTDAEARA